jgi:nucleotide sugar dehydrogenase
MNITIIGVGKLGLGLALLFEKAGYNVLGVDIAQEYIDNLNNKTINFPEPHYTGLLKESKNFRATSSLKEGVEFSDLIFIIVQTPNSGGDKFYDHSILGNVLSRINSFKPKHKDIIIGCTVMPTYIDKIGKLLLEDCEDCYLSYNPEFVAQGEVIQGFKKADIVLVGTDNPNLRPKLEQVYTSIMERSPTFCFMTPLEAEIVKITLNGFITTKISYANMVSDLCDRLGADKHIVLNAIGSDSRIGTKYFKPGYSYGGPCFPRDTRAVKLLMEQNDINSDLLSATDKYNQSHIDYQAIKMMGRDPFTSIIIEDVCYKENSHIPMIEESAKLKIAKFLVEAGKTVIIKDREDIIKEVKKEYGNIFQYETKQ